MISEKQTFKPNFKATEAVNFNTNPHGITKGMTWEANLWDVLETKYKMGYDDVVKLLSKEEIFVKKRYEKGGKPNEVADELWKINNNTNVNEQTFKPTITKPMSKQSQNFEKNFKKTMIQNNVKLNETDELLTEKEQSLKKKIFSLAKMEALVHADPKLSAVYGEMSENGEERFGYHYNETIMNMIFNDYVLNSPKYLQKYKMAIPREKKRRDQSGINQLKKAGEEGMKKLAPTGLPKKTDNLSEVATEKTKVMFLVNEKDSENSDIFAYFPEENYDNEGKLKTGYSHIGQHSAVDPRYAAESRPATPEEYQDLKTELENIGYDLEVVNGLRENEEETKYEPQDDDCFIESNGFKYAVSCSGKFIGDFEEMSDALNAVKTWKESNKWYPNTWFISDHGNHSLIDDEGNIIKETTSAGSAGGAAGYVGYAGPSAWGSGDLMKTKGKSNIMRKPIWKGGRIIQESNYLIESDGFEKFINLLDEDVNKTNVDNFIIDRTNAFTSDAVKGWNNPDTNVELDTIKTGEPDKPNLNTMEEAKKIQEKAKSASQQRLFGMAHAVQKGELSPNKVGGAVKKIAKTVSPKDVKDFAKTKHENLPEKVDEAKDFTTIKKEVGQSPQGADFRETKGKMELFYDGNNAKAKKWAEETSKKYGISAHDTQQTGKIKEDTQTMIADKPESMSNKATPTGTQSTNMDMGLRSTGGMKEEIEKTNKLLEEINNELNAYSIHHNKLKKMAEDRRPSALVLKDRLGKENVSNFKKDLQDSGTKEIIDVEKELQWKDQQTDVGDDPQKLGQNIEKKEIEVTDAKGDESLKNVGDSDNYKGDEIPKRNFTKEEQDVIDKYRLGQEDLVYDNKPSEKFEKRMEADMGKEIYKQRQASLKSRANIPMYNKDTQPTESGDVKSQYDKEKSGFNELKESVDLLTGRFLNKLGKKQLISFKLNETKEVTDVKETEEMNQIDFTGFGNKFNNKGAVNENIVTLLSNYKFFTDGKNVRVFKNPVQILTESEHKDEKCPINEEFEKMKHLTDYKPNNFVNTNNIKKNRGF